MGSVVFLLNGLFFFELDLDIKEFFVYLYMQNSLKLSGL